MMRKWVAAFFPEVHRVWRKRSSFQSDLDRDFSTWVRTNHSLLVEQYYHWLSAHQDSVIKGVAWI